MPAINRVPGQPARQGRWWGVGREFVTVLGGS